MVLQIYQNHTNGRIIIDHHKIIASTASTELVNLERCLRIGKAFGDLICGCSDHVIIEFKILGIKRKISTEFLPRT